MRNVRDTVHGFIDRPHYDESELDAMFEGCVTDFLKNKYGDIRLPISTEDLTILLERDVADLDQYADLTSLGVSVDGITKFSYGAKPRVSISETVHRHENRLRMTLMHEYGHVRLHAHLFTTERPSQLPLDSDRKPNAICLRDHMLPAGKSDWMEWQAGYASGAALMPKTHVTKLAAELQQRAGLYGPVSPESYHGKNLLCAVTDAFMVSRAAATVRLKALSIFGTPRAVSALFRD